MNWPPGKQIYKQTQILHLPLVSSLGLLSIFSGPLLSWPRDTAKLQPGRAIGAGWWERQKSHWLSQKDSIPYILSSFSLFLLFLSSSFSRFLPLPPLFWPEITTREEAENEKPVKVWTWGPFRFFQFSQFETLLFRILATWETYGQAARCYYFN